MSECGRVKRKRPGLGGFIEKRGRRRRADSTALLAVNGIIGKRARIGESKI